MALFRRLRRGRDTAEAEEPAPEAEMESPPTAPEGPTPESVEPTPEAPVSPVEPLPSAPATVEPSSAPPPLPQRTTVSPAHSGAEKGPFASCFVCGTPLEAGTCPTCRMTWME
jgi:hypothetical protein